MNEFKNKYTENRTRKNTIELSVTEHEKEYIEACAEKIFKGNISHYCRVAMLNSKIYLVKDEEIVRFNYEIDKIKNNIKQIMLYKENMSDFYKVEDEYNRMIEGVSEINRIIYKTTNTKNNVAL